MKRSDDLKVEEEGKSGSQATTAFVHSDVTFHACHYHIRKPQLPHPSSPCSFAYLDLLGKWGVSGSNNLEPWPKSGHEMRHYTTLSAPQLDDHYDRHPKISMPKYRSTQERNKEEKDKKPTITRSAMMVLMSIRLAWARHYGVFRIQCCDLGGEVFNSAFQVFGFSCCGSTAFGIPPAPNFPVRTYVSLFLRRFLLSVHLVSSALSGNSGGQTFTFSTSSLLQLAYLDAWCRARSAGRPPRPRKTKKA